MTAHGPCKRDADGRCVGACGRVGHLGRPLTVAEWLMFWNMGAFGAPRRGGVL